MAIFEGEEMVPITTPDGRTLTLPRSLVPSSMMPGAPQQIGAPVPAGFADEPPQWAPAGTPSVTGGQLPPGLVPELGNEVPDSGIVEEAPPPPREFVAGTIDNRPQTVAASNKKHAAGQAKQAAHRASPQGQMAASVSRTEGAIANEAVAVASAADVDAAGQLMVADAQHERNEAIDKLLIKRNEDAQAALAAEDAKRGEIEGFRKKIAGTKIDRKHDSPVMAAIGIMLIALGRARDGIKDGKNPGIDIYFEAIDRKVAGQMADLDQMGKIYGMRKEELDSLKARGKNKLEMHSMMVAGEIDKSVRHIEELVSRTGSQKTKESAKIAIAQLQQRAAEKSENALRWGLDFEQKEKAEKNQNSRFYSGLAETKRSNRMGEQLKREDMYLDYQKAMAAARATGGDAAMKARIELVKDNKRLGLNNVITKEPLLTVQGRAMLAEAEKAEAEAASIAGLEGQHFDPVARGAAIGRAQMLKEKASQLRGEAHISHQVQHRDPTQAGALQGQYSTVQSMTTAVDEIKDLYEKEGRRYVYTTPGQAALQSKMVGVLMDLKNAWQLGVLSKQDTALIEKAMGEKDPIDGWTPGAIAERLNVQLGKDPEGFKAALDTIVAKAQNKVYLDMNGTNFGGTKEELFYHRRPMGDTPESKAIETLSKDKTPLELENDVRGAGTARKALDKVVYPFGGGSSLEGKASAAAESGSLTHPGLSEAGGQSFDTLFKAHKSGSNPRAGDLLIAQATSNATERPELALATLRNLRNNEPDLYVKARAALPPGKVSEQLDAEDKQQIAVSGLNPVQLRMHALIGDTESQKELARRASTGDKQSQAELDVVIKQKHQMSLPSGSVFGRNR